MYRNRRRCDVNGFLRNARRLQADWQECFTLANTSAIAVGRYRRSHLFAGSAWVVDIVARCLRSSGSARGGRAARSGDREGERHAQKGQGQRLR